MQLIEALLVAVQANYTGSCGLQPCGTCPQPPRSVSTPLVQADHIAKPP